MKKGCSVDRESEQIRNTLAQQFQSNISEFCVKKKPNRLFGKFRQFLLLLSYQKPQVICITLQFAMRWLKGVFDVVVRLLRCSILENFNQELEK